MPVATPKHFTPSIITAASKQLWDDCYSYLHFIDRKTEAQIEVSSQGRTAGKRQSLNLK